MKRMLLIAMLVGFQVQVQAMEPCVVGGSACCILGNVVSQYFIKDAQALVEKQIRPGVENKLTSKALCSQYAYEGTVTAGLFCCLHPFSGAAYATMTTVREAGKYKKLVKELDEKMVMNRSLSTSKTE